MYFIFDANGKPFGNPKGYAKHSSAEGICTRYRHKLWRIYYAGVLRCPTGLHLLYEIKLIPEI